MKFSFHLPWPNMTRLSPNTRQHWARLSAARKSYKAACVQSCYFEKVPRKGWSNPLYVRLEFISPDLRRRDQDNLLSSFKAGQDALSDYLSIDDSKFLVTYKISGKTIKNGSVLVTLSNAQREHSSILEIPLRGSIQ